MQTYILHKNSIDALVTGSRRLFKCAWITILLQLSIHILSELLVEMGLAVVELSFDTLFRLSLLLLFCLYIGFDLVENRYIRQHFSVIHNKIKLALHWESGTRNWCKWRAVIISLGYLVCQVSFRGDILVISIVFIGKLTDGFGQFACGLSYVSTGLWVSRSSLLLFLAYSLWILFVKLVYLIIRQPNYFIENRILIKSLLADLSLKNNVFCSFLVLFKQLI